MGYFKRGQLKGMFYNCENLTTLDLSHFNTSLVYYMNEMFYGCKSLKSLDLSSFDTSNLEEMELMFGNCKSITSLRMPKLKGSEVCNLNEVFLIVSH